MLIIKVEEITKLYLTVARLPSLSSIVLNFVHYYYMLTEWCECLNSQTKCHLSIIFPIHPIEGTKCGLLCLNGKKLSF